MNQSLFIVGGRGRILGGIARFSGGTEGGSVVANRVQRGDYGKLTTKEGGGGNKNTTEP